MTIRFTDSATYVQHFGITNPSPNLSGWTFNGGYDDLSTSTLSQVASFDISAKSGLLTQTVLIFLYQ